MIEVLAYADHRGREPFYLCLSELGPPVQRRINRVVARIERGNLGDVRSVGERVVERRANFGPGYRIYFAWDGPTLIILLGGGDKSVQHDDLLATQERWRDYQNRADYGD